VIRNLFSKQKGFTLIELLVVIGILAILLAITLIAINPARQFSQANDTQRRSDVNSILNAVHQFMADNNGTPPTGIDTTIRTIGNTGAGNTVNICASVSPIYIADLPLDPLTGTESPTNTVCTASTYNTRYTIVRSATNNRITVEAPDTEIEVPDIQVTR